ncbi:MAG TPA: sigma-70 family RNA polymerase sigma factor [Ktedonobacterales bacterium]|nr:sigma-70 family RNA polymerase sigma factor [Ktedonobacterales bacterium]
MEEEAIRQAQSGDHSAFRKLVETHSEMAWRVARTLLADSLAAEDALQEAWIDAWRGLAYFDNTRPFRPWLLTIVANRCRMTRRRRALPTTSVSETMHTGGLFEDLADALVHSETDASLAASLAMLPFDRRRLVELRYFAQLDISEIALVLGIAEGTVKSRLHRTLATLKTTLQRAGVGAQ